MLMAGGLAILSLLSTAGPCFGWLAVGNWMFETQYLEGWVDTQVYERFI